ncbi:MAG: tellurium resistance protein TerC [Chloroflexi bacterium HGW-Chloroflexi-4]|jgi:tellurite resistance protein TerC|nr:MAG: tellurium resistance protein TerC [Chloroflexi bacterium HGW-Chloroflexi-4]
MDWSFVVIIIQLIFLEGILSIDNAAVLGAMVLPLSDTEPIPWPKALKGFGHRMDKVLGPQRVAALKVGLIGAYAGRGIMLVLASFIVANPWLKLIGAAYLIKLALDDLSAHGYSGEGDEDTKPVQVRTFWMTVLSVELMDLAFSLDNVVAAVSLSDKLWVVMMGVGIGILLMRFAAGAFSYIVQKEPILKTAAYILVFNIGVELLLEDLAHIEIGDWTRFGISAATILLSLAYAHIPFLRKIRPALIWISQGFSIINNLISWVLAPISGLFNLIFSLFKRKPVPAE